MLFIIAKEKVTPIMSSNAVVKLGLIPTIKEHGTIIAHDNNKRTPPRKCLSIPVLETKKLIPIIRIITDEIAPEKTPFI